MVSSQLFKKTNLNYILLPNITKRGFNEIIIINVNFQIVLLTKMTLFSNISSCLTLYVALIKEIPTPVNKKKTYHFLFKLLSERNEL